MSSSFNLTNTVPTNFGDGTLVRLRGGMDVIWTAYGRDGYVMRTWDRSQRPGLYLHGTTDGKVAVAKTAGGWAVRLFGEDLPEIYPSKSAAQTAAESLALAPRPGQEWMVA